MMKTPDEACIYKGWTKYIHREMLKGLLPEKIRLRRTKIGFEVPEARWLKKLHHKVREIFSEARLADIGLVKRDELLRKFDEFSRGKLGEEYARVFWRLLFLEMWLRTYITEA